VGEKENRSLPIPAYVLGLLGDYSERPFIANDGSGKPLSDDNVREIFKALVDKAGHALNEGESSHAMRHTVATAIVTVAGWSAADQHTNGKVPSNMVGQHYGLMPMREKRKLGRPVLMVNGAPVCDLLAWAKW
jgi:integrase